MCSKSFIQNAIKVKNTRYCVTKIEVILPVCDLKKLCDDALGKFFLKIVYSAKNILKTVKIARKSPCIPPHIKKFQEAPCHSPIKSIEINRLMKISPPDFLFLNTNG